MRIGSYSNKKEGNTVELDGLSNEEKEKVRGVEKGMWWMTCREGVPVFLPVFEGMPDPVEDPRLREFWPKLEKKEPRYSQFQLRDPEEYKNSSPSITISHLCGYYYTPENYAKQAKKLESFGFSCLRSKRGRDGCYYEQWYLPGLWAAIGDLEWKINRLKYGYEQEKKREKEATDGNDKGRLVEDVIHYLCREVSFGTLDVSVQRAAMTMSDD